MGFFDFLRAKPRKAKSSESEIINRWSLENGTYRDNLRSRDEIAWMVGTGWFELWFQGLERRTAQSLGRRLAHASLEHEEYMLGLGFSSPPAGRDPRSWTQTSLLWETSGLGMFGLLEDDGRSRILVDNPSSGPICSGLIAASWEAATGKRHRFLWNEGKGEGLVVTLTQDDANFPSPEAQNGIWSHPPSELSKQAPDNHDNWLDLRIDSPGQWSIMGERRMFVHLDLLLRFEEYCLPYIDGIHEGRSESFSWRGIDSARSAWWSAAADSARERFVSDGHHVLIRNDSDWFQIARRHLSRNGLGEVDSAVPIGDNGDIRLIFSSIFHPAISGGVILGCWERAFGRNGRIIAEFDDSKVSIEIRPSREIS